MLGAKLRWRPSLSITRTLACRAAKVCSKLSRPEEEPPATSETFKSLSRGAKSQKAVCGVLQRYSTGAASERVERVAIDWRKGEYPMWCGLTERLTAMQRHEYVRMTLRT